MESHYRAIHNRATQIADQATRSIRLSNNSTRALIRIGWHVSRVTSIRRHTKAAKSFRIFRPTATLLTVSVRVFAFQFGFRFAVTLATSKATAKFTERYILNFRTESEYHRILRPRIARSEWICSTGFQPPNYFQYDKCSTFEVRPICTLILAVQKKTCAVLRDDFGKSISGSSEFVQRWLIVNFIWWLTFFGIIQTIWMIPKWFAVINFIFVNSNGMAFKKRWVAAISTPCWYIWNAEIFAEMHKTYNKSLKT